MNKVNGIVKTFCCFIELYDHAGVEEKSKLKQLYIEFYQQLVEAVSDPDTCHSLTTQLHSTSLLSEEKEAVLSSSVASGRSFLKELGVEEEPHLMTVLMEKMSAVKELQTLSEDMSDWLSGSMQSIATLVCVLVMCLYYWSLGTTATQFTEKQAYDERNGEISASMHAGLTKTFIAVELHGFFAC